MKKWFSIALILLFSLTLVAVPAQAKSSKVFLKGEVQSCEPDMLVLTTTGVTVTVVPPEGFEACEPGTWVLVKGLPGEGENEVVADLVKVTEPEEDGDTEDEAGKMNGAYCSEDKKALTEFHPVATKISEAYGVEPAWVMGYFCDGFGMGAIMLALKTNSDLDKQKGAEDMLQQREDGKGWGQIWNEAKHNAETGEKVPPGQQKKESNESGAPPAQGPKKDK